MPNIFLSSGVKFNPFTYDELVKPLDRLYQEHSKVEEGLSELQTKAGIWEGLANQQSDPETYAQYKRYADELRLAANDLAVNGLTPTSRQNLFNMKARYASEITPIEQAYNSRREQRLAQEKLLAQNPDLILSREAATTNLDAYIKNPELSYKAINGAAVRERVLQEAALLGKSMSDTDLKAMLDNNDDYLEYVKRNGYSGEAILNAIRRTKDADSKLTAIAERAVKATGVYDWKDLQGNINKQAIDRTWEYASSGLWGASGSTESSVMVNQPKMQRESQAFQASEAKKERDFREREGNKNRANTLLTSGIYQTPDGGYINTSNGAITNDKGQLTHLYGVPVGQLGLGSSTTTPENPSGNSGTGTNAYAEARKRLKAAKDAYTGKGEGTDEEAKKEIVYPVTGMTAGQVDALAQKVTTVGELQEKHRLKPVVGISRHSKTWTGLSPFAFAATEGEDLPGRMYTDIVMKGNKWGSDDRAFPSNLQVTVIRDSEISKLPFDDQLMIQRTLKESGIVDDNNTARIPFNVGKVQNSNNPSRGAEYVILTDDESAASVRATRLTFPVNEKTGELSRDRENPNDIMYRNHK